MNNSQATMSRRKKRTKARSRTTNAPARPARTACVNAACKLRAAGCDGFEGCPGYKARS
jgi:hypothetical protein